MANPTVVGQAVMDDFLPHARVIGGVLVTFLCSAAMTSTSLSLYGPRGALRAEHPDRLDTVHCRLAGPRGGDMIWLGHVTILSRRHFLRCAHKDIIGQGN